MNINFFYAAVIAFSLLIVCGALAALVRRQPLAVPIIWYTFALAFCSMVVLHYAVAELKLSETNPSAHEFVVKFVRLSMDVEGEFNLLVVAFFVAVVPQISGYLLSGCSGVAERPLFVSQFTSTVAWLMAKAFAFLAGIQLQFAIFLTDNPFQPLQMERGGFFMASALSLMMAFVIVVMRLDLADILQTILARVLWLQRVHAWMQRNLEKDGRPLSNRTKQGSEQELVPTDTLRPNGP